MERKTDDRVVVRTRFLLCPALWCWEVVDADHGAVIASSWNNDWLAYESPEEALAAGFSFLRRRGRDGALATPRSELRRTA